MKTNKITLTICALTVAGTMLPASGAEESGWYLGVGGGSSRATIAQESIIADLLSSGYETTRFITDNVDFGYKLYAGYKFNRHISLEGGYFDLGKFNYTATTMPSGTKFGELDFDGWNVDLIGMIPFTERTSLYARIGAHRSTASVDFIGTGAVNVLTPYYQKTTTDYKFGVGYQHNLTKSITVRIDAERYRMDDAVGQKGDIELYSLNVIYRFGGRSATAPPPSPARTPAPAVAAPVPPVVTAEYCGDLVILFEIASDDIQRIDHEHVLVLATFLNKYPDTQVQIEGHTDNVGTELDNLQLSQQRAQSAVDYLVREHGIARDRLNAIGYGETRPVANNDTEAGKQANRRINAVIDCATDIEGLEPIPARVTLAMELAFATDSSAVDPKYHDQLSRVADYLHNNPGLFATMEGHTDNASPAMAQQLSQQRAQNVVDYLVTHFAVERSRLQAEGFGGTRRETYNITEAGRQENRRVHIIFGYSK